MRFSLVAAVAIAAVVSTGCGGDKPRSRIHGVVKYQGTPLRDATIIFIASDNRTHPIKLKPDGSYEVSNVAQGPVKVSIQQDLPKVAPRPDPGSESGSKAGVVDEKAGRRRQEPTPGKEEENRLPAIYADPEQSGLSFELKEPDKEWSVDLK